MDWSWAIDGITEDVPRTTGPECINYMTNRRRYIEMIILTTVFIILICNAIKRLAPISLPPGNVIEQRHSGTRLMLMIVMTFVFGIEMGFKLAGKSVIFVLNPCHLQTLIQIYLLAAKPSKATTALFRVHMNYLNGPFLAFLFPEVEGRTLPFEQATYWIQHALLYIIPVYMLRTDAYKMEDISDYNWSMIGVMILLTYHFVLLTILSMLTGINLSHMLCAAPSDPFQGQNYRLAAVIHESILCFTLNKITVYLFGIDRDRSPSLRSTEVKMLNEFDLNKETPSLYQRLKEQPNQYLATTTTNKISKTPPSTTMLKTSPTISASLLPNRSAKQNCDGNSLKQRLPCTKKENENEIKSETDPEVMSSNTRNCDFQNSKND